MGAVVVVAAAFDSEHAVVVAADAVCAVEVTVAVRAVEVPPGVVASGVVGFGQVTLG